MHYEHPIYTPEAVRAQSQLADLATGRTVYAAPTTGGDSTRTAAAPAWRRPALRSDLVSTALLGTPASAPARPQLPQLPALVVGQVAHAGPRTRPRHAFRHQVYQWLVDLDCLPRQPWHLRAFANFSSADHLGDPGLPIKGNIENYLALGGIGLGERGRVLMLASARVLGRVIDPLSVFWCYDSNGVLACVVAEVHNTYGERHAYLLHPDEAGTAVTDKGFYVSPFFDVSGTYELRFTLRPDTCRHDRDAAPRGRRRVLGGLPGPPGARDGPGPGRGSSASPSCPSGSRP